MVDANEERRLSRFSCRMNVIGVVVLAMTPACNVVLGNEDGVLDDDAATPELEIDANVTALDGGAPPPQSEASSSGPDATVEDSTPNADRPDPNARDATRSEGGDASSHDADARPLCDTGASVCAEGQVATDMQACGPCGRGMQTRKRTC